MKLYKVLNNGKSCNGGDIDWSLPAKNDDGTWTPGEWMPEIEGNLVACENGYHLVDKENLIDWLNSEIYEAEFEGEVIKENNKYVVRKCRLIRKIEAWNEKTARIFAYWCAEQVLPVYEKQYPGDNRPRTAIETARRYAEGNATMEELAVARAAARSAAWAAEWSAVSAAARDAACAAAWDAASTAARAAARSAARDAQSAKLLEMIGEEAE
jgi:hypothetical protein